MVEISFPIGPSDGQIFNGPNGVQYTYDGTDGKWRASAFLTTDELNDLSDVVLAGLLPGQALRYNGTNWANAYLAASEVTNTPAGNITSGDVQGALNELDTAISAIPPSATELDDLSDVTITTPVDSHILRYNGSLWVNTINAAANVISTPVGAVSATDVDGAISDLEGLTATNAAAIAALDAIKPDSDITGITGAGAVTNIVSISQTDYDAIGTPDATTLYLIDS